MDAIARFAEHVATTTYDGLPAAAIGATKTFILDSFGVGVAGSGGPWVRELIDACGAWGKADAARVWVRGTALPAAAAAMCNGYQIHNSEYDCVHEVAVVHPMAVLLAAAMAHAEQARGVSGRALLSAIALGVDVGVGLGIASKAPLRFFRPATAGAFAATAGIGKLRGFDAGTLINAFSVAYGQLCGTMQAHTEGSPLLAMQIGFNARNAVVACDLAATGLVGPQNLLQGPFGFYRLFEGAHDLGPVLGSLGKVWRIAEVAHKPFPCGRATHGVLDGVLGLMGEHGFTAPEVERIDCRVPPLTHRLVARPARAGMTSNYARLCAPYVLACALQGGGVGLDDFKPEALADPVRLDVARRIGVSADANPDSNALTPVSVAVRLRDGRAHEALVREVYGSPAKPMGREAHLAKFRANWISGARSLPEAAGEQLIRLVDDLETVRDVAELVDLMVS
ncbi:MAG: MmgE/PrpD family protein [Geminicoccaceae bacterium]